MLEYHSMPTKLVLFCKKEPPSMGLKQLMLNKCEFIKQGTSSLLILFFLQILCWNSVRDLDSRLSPTRSTALCHSELMKNSCQHATSLPEQGGGGKSQPPSSFFYSSSSSSIKNSHSFSTQGALRLPVAMVTSFILKSRRPEPLNLQNKRGEMREQQQLPGG